jgi:multiple sugar transport system substrate-binding protein
MNPANRVLSTMKSFSYRRGRRGRGGLLWKCLRDALSQVIRRLLLRRSFPTPATPVPLRVLCVLCGGALVVAVACSNAESRPTELRFWALGREGEVVQQLVRDFERENPGVSVRVQQIPWIAAHEKLLTAHVGDALPDVAQLGNTWVPEFASLKALAALDSFVAASPTLEPDSYFPGIWDTNVIGDSVYGLPWYVDTRVVFYRRDLLAKAGYATFPTTWTDWIASMRAVKSLGDRRDYPIFLPANEWPQPVLLGLQAGSPILKDGGRYGAFRDAEYRRAFEFYLSIFRENLSPVVGQNDLGNVWQEFARGHIAMWITGPWNVGEFRRRLPPGEQRLWATAPMPSPDDTVPGVSLAGGSSLVVFRSSEHKALAWKLVEFLSRPEQQVRFYELTGDLPARRESWSAPILRSDSALAAFLTQLQRVRPTPKVPEWELIATRVFDHAEQAIRGRQTADQALTALDAEVDAILEKRRWMLDRLRDRNVAESKR